MCNEMFSTNTLVKATAIAIIALSIFFIYIFILKNPTDRSHTGLIDDAHEPLPETKEAPKAGDKDNSIN